MDAICAPQVEAGSAGGTIPGRFALRKLPSAREPRFTEHCARLWLALLGLRLENGPKRQGAACVPAPFAAFAAVKVRRQPSKTAGAGQLARRLHLDTLPSALKTVTTKPLAPWCSDLAGRRSQVSCSVLASGSSGASTHVWSQVVQLNTRISGVPRRDRTWTQRPCPQVDRFFFVRFMNPQTRPGAAGLGATLTRQTRSEDKASASETFLNDFIISQMAGKRWLLLPLL